MVKLKAEDVLELGKKKMEVIKIINDQTARGKAQDERKRAKRIVSTPEEEKEWEQHPNKLDKEGVDTPDQVTPYKSSIEGQVRKTDEKESEDKQTSKTESKITTFYNEGEYLSGYMPSGTEAEMKRLNELGLSEYVSGWGTKISDKVIEALGKEFTIEQAEAYAKPILEAKAKRIEEQKQKKQSNEAEKFAEAKRTNKPVVLKQWSEECNDPSEECSVDNITVYAMPDGKTKRTRSHTW